MAVLRKLFVFAARVESLCRRGNFSAYFHTHADAAATECVRGISGQPTFSPLYGSDYRLHARRKFASLVVSYFCWGLRLQKKKKKKRVMMTLINERHQVL